MKDHPPHTLPSSGSALSTTLDAGIDIVKISLEELIAEGCAKSGALPDLVDGIQRPQQAGALAVVLSRAAAPTLALTGTAQATGLIEVRGPTSKSSTITAQVTACSPGSASRSPTDWRPPTRCASQRPPAR